MAAATGAVLEQVTVPATPAGDRQLLRLADRYDGGRVWAIEGTGGYGAGLTRFLSANHEQVVELDRPKRTARRHGAKSDPLDAIRAAREALAATSSPSRAPPATARRSRAAGRKALGGPGHYRRPTPAAGAGGRRPDTLCERLRGLTTPRLVSTCGRLRLRAALMSRPSQPQPACAP